MAMKSLKEKWLSIVQSAGEKGEKGIGGSSTVTDCLIVHVRGRYVIRVMGQGVRGAKVFSRNVFEGEIKLREVK